jgi:GWxTD domain-containing protein
VRLALLLALLLWPCAAGAQVLLAPPRPNEGDLETLHAKAEANPHDAQALAAYARALMARDGLEDRIKAQKLLKDAVALTPRDVDLRLALADLYYRQGYFTLSRRQLQAALRTTDDATPAYVRLGRLALRDWRKFQRPGSLEAARRYWQDALKRTPGEPEPWLGLGLLALVDRDARGALAAGRQVLASPKALTRQIEGEALLLVGAGAYGSSLPAVADSAFNAALEKLPTPVRETLTDITPAASDADTAAYLALFNSGDRARFLATFWKARDPDLTTPYNEVRLEMLARGVIGYFLYYDAKRRTWDERGNYLVRYGLPDFVEYNPPVIEGELGGWGSANTNRLVWHYRQLGFYVYLEDRYLNEFYDIPVSLHEEVDFMPQPEVIEQATRSGAAAVAGRGVFRTVLPGQTRLEGVARLGLFRRVEGFDPRVSSRPASILSMSAPAARVEAYLAVKGRDAPREIEGDAVVYRDSSFTEIARVHSGLAAACLSDSVGLLQFNFDLPPGNYVVGLSARDSSHDAIGSWRLPVTVTVALPGRLEVSDLELACGVDAGKRATPFAKTDYSVYPNPLAQAPRDQPFGFYFEVYNLVSDDKGAGQVSIEYQIQSTKKDKRPFFVKIVNPRKNDPVVNVAKVDEVAGRARFQYVSANLAAQPPGPYRIQVTVTDLANNVSVTKSVDFELIN